MRLNEILGTEYPIIQGGMANIATGTFAAAVSNAGALGLIGAGGMSAAQLRQEIQTCKSLTQKPFGVNIMLMNPEADEMAKIVVEEQVPVVTTGAGNPGKYMAAWKEAGIKVIPVVPAVVLAKRMENAGADAVIAEGTESGGHVGEMTTMALVPQVIDAVNIPVDNDTIVTGRIAGVPVRILKNRMARQYVKQEKAGADKMELEKYTLGSLRRAVFDGDTDTGSLMAGQVAGMLTEIRPLRVIFEDLMAGMNKCLAQLEQEKV